MKDTLSHIWVSFQSQAMCIIQWIKMLIKFKMRRLFMEVWACFIILWRKKSPCYGVFWYNCRRKSLSRQKDNTSAYRWLMISYLYCNSNDYTKIQTTLFKANNLSIALESKPWQTMLGKYIWPHVIYSLKGSLKNLYAFKMKWLTGHL